MKMNVPEFKNLWLFDQNKLAILYVLINCEKQDKICGCDLVGCLDIPKNLLSYHIKILREKGYIEEEKCGRKKVLRVCEGKRELIKSALDLAV